MVLWLGLLDARNAEICLLATQRTPRSDNQTRYINLLFSPVEQHSKKPDITREKILALMGDLPRIELFARQHTPGWDVWGNEIKSDIRFAGRRFEMAYVTVPKDLTKIKSKVMFNLTKRQLLCFVRGGGYRATAILLTKDSAGTTTAALCMVLPCCPCSYSLCTRRTGNRWK